MRRTGRLVEGRSRLYVSHIGESSELNCSLENNGNLF